MSVNLHNVSSLIKHKHMKHTNIILLIISFFFIISSSISCGKKCISGAGKTIKKERTIDDFTQIELYGVFNVYLKSGNKSKIEIEMGENLISNIETKVKDKVLTINDNNSCDYIKGYADKNLHITIDTLTQLIVYDAAKLFTVDTLKTPNLNIIFKSEIGYSNLTVDCKVFQFSVWFGTGDYYLQGKADYFAVGPHYLSFIYAQNLKSKDCRAYSNSMGDLYINTNNLLYVKIQNEGNIYYSGNPNKIIVEEDTGKGKLIKY